MQDLRTSNEAVPLEAASCRTWGRLCKTLLLQLFTVQIFPPPPLFSFFILVQTNLFFRIIQAKFRYHQVSAGFVRFCPARNQVSRPSGKCRLCDALPGNFKPLHPLIGFNHRKIYIYITINCHKLKICHQYRWMEIHIWFIFMNICQRIFPQSQKSTLK